MNFEIPLSLAEFPEPKKIFTANGRLSVAYNSADFYTKLTQIDLGDAFVCHRHPMIFDTDSGMLLEHIGTANLIEGQIFILIVIGAIEDLAVCANNVIQINLDREFVDNYDFNKQANYSGAS